MRNLVLMAAAATLALPVAAQAATEKMEKKWYDGETSMIFKVQDGQYTQSSPFVPEKGETLTLDLVEGGQLVLEGEAAYIVNENGDKYFANDAPHMTTAGIAYQTADGLVLYAIPGYNTYTFTADVQDEDRDGYADDVDFTIKEQQ